MPTTLGSAAVAQWERHGPPTALSVASAQSRGLELHHVSGAAARLWDKPHAQTLCLSRCRTTRQTPSQLGLRHHCQQRLQARWRLQPAS